MPTAAPESDVGERLSAGTLDEAVYWTVLYSDLFDYPLTRNEIFRFLVTWSATRTEVDAAVDRALENGYGLETDGNFLYLAGRTQTVARRLERGRSAGPAWRKARRYARLMWALPYVRMIAVTGALASDNVLPRDDIDFLIVTEPGRLWMTRGMIVLLCKLARLRGDTLCPNYLISSRALQMDRRDLYGAHELAQMVPMHGRSVAHKLWAENPWCENVLPNAGWNPAEVDDDLPRPVVLLKELAERALRLPAGDRIEAWERRRKIVKLSRQVPPDVSETLFTVEICKGHHNGHGDRVMRLFEARQAQRKDGVN